MSPRRGIVATQHKATSLQNKKKISHFPTPKDHTNKIDPKVKSANPKYGRSTQKNGSGGAGFSSITPDDSEPNSDSDPGEHDSDNDNKENEADEPDEIAPSDINRKKRGHQTGLSVSLSNTKIDGGVVTRKRAWSNRVHEEGEEETKQSTKTSKQRVEDGVLTSDDEDNYDGVDMISESGDERDLEKEEEQLIILSEEENPYLGEEEGLRNEFLDSWEGFEDAGLPNVEENPFFSEHFGRMNPNNSNALYHRPDANRDSPPAATPSVTRRVRFVDEVGGSVSSSSNESEVDQEIFPDLFLQQDKLDPSFRKMLEQDGASSDSEGSYWDLGYHDDEQLELEKVHRLDQDEPKTDSSFSGYESTYLNTGSYFEG